MSLFHLRGDRPTDVVGTSFDAEFLTKSVGVKRRRDVGEDSSSKFQIKKVKKLERSEGLGAGTLHARLISAGISTEPYPINLDETLCASITGGNSQAAFPAIAEEWCTKTGHRYFTYPNRIQNPDAPMVPGAPGLFLAAVGRSAKECNVEWTSGIYKAEWTDQKQQMRNRWCKKLAKKDWGRITRTRIALRRQLQRDPTFEEVDTALETDQKYLDINADDIAQGFDNGDERLAVWTMKCVGYDEQLQRDLVRQITGWVPPSAFAMEARRGTNRQAQAWKGAALGAIEIEHPKESKSGQKKPLLPSEERSPKPNVPLPWRARTKVANRSCNQKL
ncbi:hypothetical protein MVEN_02445500 [Mycena venus]|uniref:DUF6697 domain-containing protein n=1 Tax=Mycena venus TaxID=2733690 RepID=A0A8H6WYJ3_9AGAR|nr:hypothetical protein MVEN_02445500 [Mycena venus]